MIQSFLITLREGLEAALIVGIVLAYLVRISRRDQFRPVWLGTGLAVVFSLVAGAVILAVAGGLEGQAEKLFEGFAMLLAVGVLTWMVLWMKRQAANIRAHLQAQVDTALAAGSALALGSLAFVAVAREGLETALFMFAVLRTATPMESAVGGLLGLGVAIFLGYLIYAGSRRLNLRLFFGVTGVLLILFAAGLLAHGIAEFEGAGLIPILVKPLWDINHILNEKEGVGAFLKALFGYDGNPSLTEVVAYGAYLVGALWIYFHPTVGVGRQLAAESA